MSDDFPVAPAVDPTWNVEIDCGQSSGNSLPLAHQGIPDILAARRHPTIVPHTPRGTEHRCFWLAAGNSPQENGAISVPIHASGGACPPVYGCEGSLPPAA